MDNVERFTLQTRTGLTFSLIDWGGDGPLALLLHANSFCAALWEPVARSLRSRYRVVGLDSRGHGDSDAPPAGEAYAWDRLGEDLIDVADQVRAKRGDGSIALGLGHSIGGTLMLMAESRHTGLFERLVLADPVLLPLLVPAVSDEQARAILIRTAGVLRAAQRLERWESREQARAHLATRKMFSSWRLETFELYIQEGLREGASGGVELKCSAAVEAAVLAGSSVTDLSAAASRVWCPTLILWAEKGNLKREQAEVVAGNLKRGEVEAFASSHMVPMEEPERLGSRVLRFARTPG